MVKASAIETGCDLDLFSYVTENRTFLNEFSMFLMEFFMMSNTADFSFN